MAHNAEYDAYLRSPAWAAKRVVALECAGHRCQVCNRDKRLDVHHRTYDRFGDEDPGDLTVLCRPCHELFHGAGKKTTGSGTKKRKKKKTGRSNPKGSAHRAMILAFLVDNDRPEGWRGAEIAGILDLPPNKVNGCLGAMRNSREVQRANRKRGWRAGAKARRPITVPKKTSSPKAPEPASRKDIEALAAQLGARLVEERAKTCRKTQAAETGSASERPVALAK